MQWGRGCDQRVYVWPTGRVCDNVRVIRRRDQADVTKGGVCVRPGVCVTMGCTPQTPIPPLYGQQAGVMHPVGILF